MPKQNSEALKLPDQLLVRYFREGEIEEVKTVTSDKESLTVQLASRTDRWRDLGGGLGYVPDAPES